MHSKPYLILLALGTISAFASAQIATIRIIHDDADGVVDPGQVVRLSAMLNYNPQSHGPFGATGGSVLSSRALGQTSALSTQYGPSLTVLGTPVPGGVTGFRAIGFSYFHWPVIPPPYNMSTPTRLLSFDWTVPTAPGPHEFNYIPSAEFPLVQLYPVEPPPPEFPVPVSTAYLGTTLIVTPAPASAALLALATITLRRRR